MLTETMVRTYRETRAFENDARRLAHHGWRVRDTATRQPRRSLVRILLLGVVFAWVFPRKPEIVVTYQHERDVTPHADA